MVAGRSILPDGRQKPLVWKTEGRNSPSCNKKPAPYQAGLRRGTNNDLGSVRTHEQRRIALEAEPVIYGRGGRGTEIGKRDQVLEVVGEPVQHVGECSEFREALFWITDLENAARRVIPVEVHGQRIVSPLADFM